MKTALQALSLLACIAGVAIFGVSKSAIHEIEAFLLFIISAVLFSGAAIYGELCRLREALAPTSAAPGATKQRTVKNQVAAPRTEPSEQAPRTEDMVPITKLKDDPARAGVIRAQCNNCQKILTYQAKLSGKETSCPDCKVEFALP